MDTDDINNSYGKMHKKDIIAKLEDISNLPESEYKILVIERK